MIERLAVRNFQSLKDVKLGLGRFTVIVGPSSSGKSALVRALRLLASNSRGAPYVTHGEKVASVSALLEDTIVTVERGEGKGEYRLNVGGEERTFTKLGGTVPAEVTQALNVEPNSELTFAGQFDRPYLLTSSGSEVARTLGALTNVHIIFEASREATKRARQSKTALKLRQEDLQRLVARAQEFRGLKGRLAARDEAGQLLEVAADVERRFRRLGDFVERLDIAEQALARAEQRAAVEVPSVADLEKAQDRLFLFRQRLALLAEHRKKLQSSEQLVAGLAASLEDLHERHHRLLVEAGECPTCGQSTAQLRAPEPVAR